MADKFRFYIICDTCGGTGLVPWGESPSQGGNQTCPTCEDDPGNPLAPVVFDGLRHIYAGRFEEVEEE
jgi:hypothetical protein